jgi:site-specific recombinase XerD
MSAGFEKVHQIATRKKLKERLEENLPEQAGTEEGAGGGGESRLPVRLDLEDGNDSLAGWLEAYFAVEVTTAKSSRAVQRRDLTRFLRFMQAEEGSDERSLWTSRLSRAFLDDLRSELAEDGSRYFSDRTIARMTAHLKTFAKWIHSLRPFRLGNPTEKLPAGPAGPGLEIERALSESQRRKLLDAADHLPVLGGRSKDRRRSKDIEFADERPRRKGYRPWRNRAIIYCLIETGMRRAAVCSLDLAAIDFDANNATVREKGGQSHRYKIGKEAVKAIKDYLREERGIDQEMFPRSPALFLPAETVVNSSGRLTPRVINTIWDEACRWANVKGKTPHAARHAMGRHIMHKTGNVAAVQRQLGHKNAAYSLQYSRITDDELQKVVDAR